MTGRRRGRIWPRIEPQSTRSISMATVNQLQVAWRFPLSAAGPYGAVAAVPLVVGETIYLQDTESNVFALDRETGQSRWHHEYAELTAGPNGVAAGYGLVVGSTGLKADVFALDAATGDEVWRTPLSSNPDEFVLMQPVIYDNVVYAATSPGRVRSGNARHPLRPRRPERRRPLAVGHDGRQSLGRGAPQFRWRRLVPTLDRRRRATSTSARATPRPGRRSGIKPRRRLAPGRTSTPARWSRSTRSPGRCAGSSRRRRTTRSITTSN